MNPHLRHLLLLALTPAALAATVPAEENPMPPTGGIHSAAEYRVRLTTFQPVARVLADSEQYAWNWLGEGAVRYAEGNWDEAMKAFGNALSTENKAVRPQAHFNLGNVLYQRAALEFKEMLKAGKKDQAPEKQAAGKALEHVIAQLEDALPHYAVTLESQPEHAQAAKNKKIVEDLLKKLKAQQQQQQEKNDQKQQDKQKQDPKEKDKGDKKEPEKGDQKEKQESGEKGEQSKQEGEEKGKSEQPEGQGQGENGEKKDPAGQKGEPQQQGQPGQEGEQKDKSATGSEREDKRSEEEKQKDQQARENSNKEREGKVEAVGPQKPAPGKEPKPENSKDAQINKETGFSPQMARRQAAMMSDEVLVRPQNQARPEIPFKNW